MSLWKNTSKFHSFKKCLEISWNYLALYIEGINIHYDRRTKEQCERFYSLVNTDVLLPIVTRAGANGVFILVSEKMNNGK